MLRAGKDCRKDNFLQYFFPQKNESSVVILIYTGKEFFLKVSRVYPTRSWLFHKKLRWSGRVARSVLSSDFRREDCSAVNMKWTALIVLFEISKSQLLPDVPSAAPTSKPTRRPRPSPTLSPSTTQPSFRPTRRPRPIPTSQPTPLSVEAQPSPRPTQSPSSARTEEPTSPAPSGSPITSSPSFRPTSASTMNPTTARPSLAPSSVPTVFCGETVDLWNLATSFEEGFGQWRGGEEFGVSTGWRCDSEFDRCWSRTNERDTLTAGTNAQIAADGDWWAYVESSNTGENSARPDDSNPFKKFVLRSPDYPELEDVILNGDDAAHYSGARSGFLWPPACDLALAFEYTMYGATLGNLSLVAHGCFDSDESLCATAREDECDASLAGLCPLACDACDAGALESRSLWSLEGEQGSDWAFGVAIVPTGTKRLEFVVFTGTGETSDVALDNVRLAPPPSASPTSSMEPTVHPTSAPSLPPTRNPTPSPSSEPSLPPTTEMPTPLPTTRPNPGPTSNPSFSPSTETPTSAPTTFVPSLVPTLASGSSGGGGGGGQNDSLVVAAIAFLIVLCLVLLVIVLLCRRRRRRRRDYSNRNSATTIQKQASEEDYLPAGDPSTIGGGNNTTVLPRARTDSRRTPPPPPSMPAFTSAPQRTVDEELRTCVDHDAVMVLDDPAYRGEDDESAERKDRPHNFDSSLPFLDSSAGWPMEMLEFAAAAELEEDLDERKDGDDQRSKSSKQRVQSAQLNAVASSVEDNDWGTYDARVQPTPNRFQSFADDGGVTAPSPAAIARKSPSTEAAAVEMTQHKVPPPPPLPPQKRRSGSGTPGRRNETSVDDEKMEEGGGGGGVRRSVSRESSGSSSARRLRSSSERMGSFSTAGGRRPVATVIGDFNVTHMIGKGSFGRVLLALKRSGTERGRAFAIKVLDKNVVRVTGQAAHTRAERETLAALRHPFVVRLRYAFQSKDRLYLVTDFYAGGSLERHLDDAHPNGLSHARTLYYSASLVAALRHCHAAGVVHRDIKPGNVLVDARGDVALTDFGLCALGVLEDGAPLRSFCGTITYMAPELLVGNAYGTSVDWWALGALIFEMASGRPPFEDPNRRRMFYNILNIPPPYPLKFTGELVELLSGLLEKRAERRLGVVRPVDTSKLAPPPVAAGESSTPRGSSVATSASAATTATPQQLQVQLQQQKNGTPPPSSQSSNGNGDKKPNSRRRPKILGMNLLSSNKSSTPPISETAAPPPPPKDDGESTRMGRCGDPIKSAAYFAQVDWTALVERRLNPPWIPSLSAPDDVAYVPKRVRDRRSSSIHDEFGGEELVHTGAATHRQYGGGEARISRQTASFGTNGPVENADAALVAQIREGSNNMWGDFSYAAPPRGGTIQAANGNTPAPVSVAPS